MNTVSSRKGKQQNHGDHLIVLINGAEDDLGCILGYLQLGFSDGSSMVQDDHNMLRLGPDCRDVDGSRRRRTSMGVPSDAMEMLT